MKKCLFIGCGRKHKAKGYCAKHYKKLLRWGNPIGIRERKANGMGCIRKDGYTTIQVKGKSSLKHRLIWEKIHKKKLKITEVIHHIDGNPNNNDISNLILINNHSQHLCQHNKNRWEMIHKELGEDEQHKYCFGCKKLFLLSNFHKHKNFRRGLHTYCKECRSTKRRA